MNFSRKLVIQFVIQHICILFTLLIAVLISFMYLIYLVDTTLYESNVPEFDSYMISQSVSLEDGRISLDSDVKDIIKEKNDWLQIVDENGKVLYDFNSPDDIPSSYTKTTLVAYLQNHIQTPYQMTYWDIELEEKQAIVIYGGRQKSHTLLYKLQQEHGAPLTADFSLTEQEKKYLAAEDATLQVFNGNGEEIFSYPKKSGNSFSAIQTALAEKEPWNHKENISSFYNPEDQTLFIMTVKNDHYSPSDMNDILFEKKLFTGFGIIFLVVFICLVLLSIWYGRKFVKPLLYTMRWLKNIAEGKFEEPVNKKGKAIRFRRSGKEKWSFRLFKDVTGTLEHLSNTLKKNEEMRKLIEQTREEWITGLTHDLKTPLSSIYGYSLLLESSQYNWDNDDIQEFGHIIRDKSQYMTTLIDDLSLTYQLKNNAIPSQYVKVEINQFVQKILLQFINNPTLQNQNIELVPSSQEIHYCIEEKWFQRIVENLLANAVKHNHEATNVIVKLAQDKHSFTLSISDNGKGMDTQTQECLFDRYYRGTNTEENSAGTGLGLAITKQLVLAHNGTITIESELGKGTSIMMTFPFSSNTKKTS